MGTMLERTPPERLGEHNVVAAVVGFLLSDEG